MINRHILDQKLNDAAFVLRRSMGDKGIYAGSGLRYDQQCWTRDMALALVPALEVMGSMPAFFKDSDVFTIDDYRNCYDAHLGELAMRQGYSGAIPILYADDFAHLVLTKLGRGSWDGQKLNVGSSFVLRRIFDGMFGKEETFPEFADFPEKDEQRGLYRLTPGTTDSELLFAFAVYSQERPIYDDAARRAIAYLEKHYVHDGLHHGADWRDTMEVFFRDKPLLTNNALLYAVYRMECHTEKAKALKVAIERTFWTGETYLDYPGSTRFDPLGGSLAVLHGLVPAERYGAVLSGFKSVDTPHGVTIACKHNPYQEGEAEVIDRTNGVVVWPFVVGFTVLAAIEMGEYQFALEQFEKLHNLNGFGEWYNPADGKLWGEPEQGWSAAMYIRAAAKLIDKGLLK